MPDDDLNFYGPPELAAVLKFQVDDVAPPDNPTDIPREMLLQYYRDTYHILVTTFKMPVWLGKLLAGLVLVIPATAMAASKIFILVLQPFLPAFGGAVFEIIDDLRKTLDPQFAVFSVAILNELLGTDFTVDHFAKGEDIQAHLARAQEIGFLLHKQLMSEFLGAAGITLDAAAGTFSEVTAPAGAKERITPTQGVRAAARFSGLLINFGTATGIIGTLGGLVPEVHLNELREIGEEVARNLGLGRLHRMALKPVIQILLAEPYKWFINELARPTQFKLGEVVNSFTGGIMKPEVVWTSLAREGYSDDKIKALLELHRKKLSESDVLTLFEGGHLEESQVVQYYQRLGYTEEDARAKAEADRLKATRPYFEELRAAVVTAYADRHIDRAEMLGMIAGLPLSKEEKDYIILAADYKAKLPFTRLTIAQIEAAFSEGIIDVTEFNAHLASHGYSDDDQSILLLLTLLKLNKAKEKAAVAEARVNAKAAKKAGGSASPLPPEPAPGG